MHVLDDLKKRKSLDQDDMLSHIVDLPDQFARAWDKSKTLTLPSPYIRFSNVVLLGMGGSAIGASLAAALAQVTSHVPIIVIRDYSLPQFVGRDTLIVALSYSGMTEETISAFREAVERGAKLIAISSGGELEALASRAKAPLFKVEYESLPRSALGHLFIPVLAIFSKLGILSLTDEDLAKTVARLEAEIKGWVPDQPFAQNWPKKIAQNIHDKIVVFLSTGRLAEAARRWKTQLGENSKHNSFLDLAPELCHNTIVGLDNPETLNRSLYFLLFTSAFDHPRNILRLNHLESLLKKKGYQYESIKVEKPDTPLSELSLLVSLGDFVSFYLAILNGVDPSPIAPIVELKEYLARHK